jgi:short-subunit dehydrogenase
MGKKVARIDVGRFGPWAVVTGASSGIGREAARQLAVNGFNLVLVARRKSVLEQVGQELGRENGISHRVIEADLSTEEGQRNVVENTADLDVGLLVSNAGMGQPGNFLSFEEADLRRVAQLNGVSYMYLAHAFGRRFAKRGKGGILLVSALGADSGVPYNTKEAASKAMVSTLGRCLHHEFRPLGINVSVLVVTPTATPIIDKMGLSLADMPMKPMPVEDCVRAGLKGVQANRLMVIPGALYKIMVTLMPHGLARQMTANMMRKSTQFVN